MAGTVSSRWPTCASNRCHVAPASSSPDAIVGGTIPRNYLPAVQKGVEEAMAAGGVHGFPVVDVHVECFDGKYHSVDSSEMAFKTAGSLGFKEAIAAAGTAVLEPISLLHVVVPSALQGDVMSDVLSRRGRVQGTDTALDGYHEVVALVPDRRVDPLRDGAAVDDRWPRSVHRAARSLRGAASAPRRQGQADVAETMTSASAHYATYPSLVDRGVFITGGAAGIGSALVEQFCRQESRVAFVDLDVEGANATIERCRAAGVAHEPMFIHVDLLDIAALQRACAEATAALGAITVLVNNAANDDRHDWRDMTPEYFDNRINTNLRHYFFAIQALAPGMIEAGNGSIINIGSSSYLMQEDMFPGYAIAKSAVEGITRTMARTFGPDGVRVNTVMPGWVPTERQLAKWWSPEGEQATMNDQAIKRRITPDEFAQMVLFLAADDGAACTAQHFIVDGGRF